MVDFCFVCAGLVLLGIFYVFAGIVATRAALTSYVLDWAIAGISLKKPARAETLRTAWLLGASFLVLAGGLSLTLRTELACWIFVISALGQALYIAVLAPRYFDAEDPPDPQGRRQTINAFVVYTLVTSVVAWAGQTGHLNSLSTTPWTHYALIGFLLFAHTIYVAVCLLKLKAAPSDRRFNEKSDAPSDNQGP